MSNENPNSAAGNHIARYDLHLHAPPYPHVTDVVVVKAKALALRVMADRLEHGEGIPI